MGNPFFFTGRRFDWETRLYDYRTRWYDPIAGRFTSRDSIGIWGDGLNLGNAFAYVGNNPWSRLDPTGCTSTPEQQRAWERLIWALDRICAGLGRLTLYIFCDITGWEIRNFTVEALTVTGGALRAYPDNPVPR